MLSPLAVEKIRSLADEISRREGCRLYDLEFSSQNKNRILRVFIDTDSNADTVSVDQCANVSRGLSLLLDVEDIIPGGQYELEVSSPGIDRPLREPWHFRKVIGKEIKVVTLDPVEGLKGEVKSLVSNLVMADEKGITMKHADVEVHLPYQNIKRAQVVFSLKKNEKKR